MSKSNKHEYKEGMSNKSAEELQKFKRSIDELKSQLEKTSQGTRVALNKAILEGWNDPHFKQVKQDLEELDEKVVKKICSALIGGSKLYEKWIDQSKKKQSKKLDPDR